MFDSISGFILFSIFLLLSLAFHEFAHAFVADKLGDDTPRLMGRLTLNPIAHLDPIGTILLLSPLHFGWGKPVPFNPYNLKHPRRDAAYISIAGPVSNLFLAVFFTIIYRVLPLTPLMGDVIFTAISVNLSLAFFNLLPFDPLDGFKVVYGFLPPSLALQWGNMQKWGSVILLIMILTGTIGFIIYPPLNFSLHLLGF